MLFIFTSWDSLAYKKLKLILFKKLLSLTCGSRLNSERQAGGPGGDGHSNDTYEPERSHSVRNDDDFGGYNWKYINIIEYCYTINQNIFHNLKN